jgi:hypothetical protein
VSAADSETRTVDVRASFRHSAGRLGSAFLLALRDGRLLGWKSGDPARVVVPPRETGAPGEWIALGPGATLEAYVPNDWLPASVDGSCFALVTVDGADTALVSRLRPAANMGALARGAKLTLRFADQRSGAMTDFWFEPQEVRS